MTDTKQVDPPKTRVVTVRMPAELHAQAKAMAHSWGRSLNQLCVAAISMFSNPEIINLPEEDDDDA